MDNKKLAEQTMSKMLSFIAPGTEIRDGIENVLRANTGGLIVLGYNEKVKGIVDGGFQINCPFSPSYLYELSKMDGAIILNDKGSKILIANAQLTPDTSIPSFIFSINILQKLKPTLSIFYYKKVIYNHYKHIKRPYKVSHMSFCK